LEAAAAHAWGYIAVTHGLAATRADDELDVGQSSRGVADADQPSEDLPNAGGEVAPILLGPLQVGEFVVRVGGALAGRGEKVAKHVGVAIGRVDLLVEPLQRGPSAVKLHLRLLLLPECVVAAFGAGIGEKSQHGCFFGLRLGKFVLDLTEQRLGIEQLRGCST
jgi:hypothetical protein